MFYKSSTGCMSSKQEAVISAKMMGMKGYQKQKEVDRETYQDFAMEQKWHQREDQSKV